MVLKCDIHIERKDDLSGKSYFKLSFDDEIIISINSSNDYETYSIYYGILGMIVALIKEHKLTKNAPSIDLIEQDGKVADSNPLFIPIGGIGDCGYEDIGIKLNDTIVTFSRLNGKQWEIPLSDYIDVIIHCTNEILNCFKGDIDKETNWYHFEPNAWFAIWLIEKVALESSENVGTLLTPKLIKLSKSWKIALD